jgi:hypothetical protein
MLCCFLLLVNTVHKNMSKCHNGPVIQGTGFITVFISFFRKLPDYCLEYIPIISFRMCKFLAVNNHLRSSSDLVQIKYLFHNVQVVFGFANELVHVDIQKAELNRFCGVI